MEADPLDQGERFDRLERPVGQLEAEVAELRRTSLASPPALAPTPGTAATRTPTAWAPPPAPRPWPAPAARPVGRERAPISVDGEVVLKWGDVALVVLAVGFAVSTAISRGWIGPELRLVGAAAVSIGLVDGVIRRSSPTPR